MPKKGFHFSISERKLLLRVIDAFVVVAGLIVLGEIVNFHYGNISNERSITWYSTLVFYLLLFGQIFELYDLRVANDKYLSFRSIVLTSILTTVTYVFTPIIAPVLPDNRLQILYLFTGIVVLLSGWRLFYIFVIFSPRFFKRVLFIGSSAEVLECVTLSQKVNPETFVVGYINEHPDENSSLEYFDMAEKGIQEIVNEHLVSEVVVEVQQNNFYKKQVTPILIQLFEEGVTITGIHKYKEKLTTSIPEAWLCDTFYNYLSYSKSQESRLYLFGHRLFDMVISLMGLIFLVLLVPFLLFGNLLGNRGPLFYVQTRIGKGGKPFQIFKLRSMVKNAETQGAVWATKNDVRTTKFGKFLRKTRLDEVPQFINVLKGEMCLIGPRPERPEFVKELEQDYPFYAIRHIIKPGLTGWAQVKFPYARTKEEQSIKLRYDLYYIKERNLLLDFKILIKTISTVLFFRGS